MAMKALPIRLRLSLWYFAIFAAAACLLSIASWWMLVRSVDATEYHELQERAQDVQLLLAHEYPSRGLEDRRRDLAAMYAIKDDGKWLQVLDEDGNWLFRSKRMVAQNPNLPRAGELPAAGAIAEFHQATHQVRTLAYPIAAQGRRYSVQTGISMDRSNTLLRSFATNLLLLTPGMILLAALGGHWMSRKALRPVAQLAAEARRIHDRNLETRLPVPEAKDEISDLSKTLNQMLERIDKAFASVRAFTGNASHELRTPITLLRTEIEVALYRPREPEEYRSTLLRLHEETIRMTNLAENLLSLARADGGAETMTLHSIRVRGLFKRLEQSWSRTMQNALLDFRMELPDCDDAEGEDLYALGDEAGMVRLLSILLENASQYTPPGGSVVLSASRVAGPQNTSQNAGEYVSFSVRDTGIGIAEEDKPRIFDRFYRADHRATVRSSGCAPGSGLGLALGKWIAERHGTKLVVESAPGGGSRFSFLLASMSAHPLASEAPSKLYSR